MTNKYLLADCYRRRFQLEERFGRQKLWEILCRLVFQKYINPREDVVMDIGAGYCEFLHGINCKTKIAVDQNPDTKTVAGREILVVIAPADKIPSRFDGKIDVIMMSNFLEHLATKDEVLQALMRSFKLLKPKGYLIVMGPNIDLVKNHYWDFFDHSIALNGRSYREGLILAGFTIEEYTERFLPYTTKSRFQGNPFWVKVYLQLPQCLRLFAGQSLIIARKPPLAKHDSTSDSF